ncbi:MAG: putative DNA binding domain-containing protein [Rubrivivax sp.]|nr:putative DNA binding domain-containing protein [Rubrivivax sp.]
MSMTRDELLAKLNSIEWDDIEFKEALWEVPKSALSTVSAFANTSGGHLVFGVREANGSFVVQGVTGADRVQDNFLGLVRDAKKVSVFLPITSQPLNLSEGTVLVFFIPEAHRSEKPVFLDGNPKNAFIRRGGRDDTCTGDELLRFMRDGAGPRFDGQLVPDLNVERCFDPTTVRWYRKRLSERDSGRYDTLTDIEFLQQMGCVAEQEDRLVANRAGVLAFGTDAAFRQVLQRPVVDFRVYQGAKAEYSSSVRWIDRLDPMPEENLFKTWQAVIQFYNKHADHPFGIDAGTLFRADAPPDYVSFREAAINLLIHQDFGDVGRKPSILFFRDQTEFFNPGDAFSSVEHLIDPGEKPVRNPSVVSLFRRIGLSEQAGSGVGAIYASWRELGNMLPTIENDRVEKTFLLRLTNEKLLTEAQLLAQAQIGVRLTEQEAAVFAYLARKGRVTLVDVKGLTGLNSPDAVRLVQRLTVQALVEVPVAGSPMVRLAEPFRQRFLPESTEKSQENQWVTDSTDAVQATVQVTPGQADTSLALVQLSAIQRVIIELSDTPRTGAELKEATGLRHRANFVTQHLNPLLAAGVLRRTIPQKPTSPMQQYALTEIGLRLKALHSQSTASDVERQSTK